MAGRLVKEFTKGLWKDLPPFRLVLGLCAVLAVTKSASNGLGMGLAVIFVLTLSNMFISMVRNIIPSKVRIACFIVISAVLRLPALSFPRHLRPPHRGELHHPGPGRSFCG